MGQTLSIIIITTYYFMVFVIIIIKKLCFIIFPRLHVKFYIVTKPLIKVFFFNRGTDLINGACFFIRQDVGTGKELV